MGISSVKWFAELFRVPQSETVSTIVPVSGGSVSEITDLPDWFPSVLVSPSMIAKKAMTPATLEEVLQIMEKLTPDQFTVHMVKFYRDGLNRFGSDWMYADLITILQSASALIKPKNYLEIGVRRGRSMAMVAATQPTCNIYGFDMWVKDYAGIENPGPDFVKDEMSRLGHRGSVQLVSGDSHETVPKFLQNNPTLFFDMVTVDGDHSDTGAEQDILDILPRVSLGGLIAFDDICHPSHRYLRDVWNKTVGHNPKFATWSFTELGFGIATAIRIAQ